MAAKLVKYAMTDENADPADLVGEIIDAVALIYPHDGSPEEKAAWMEMLQRELEARKDLVQEMIRKGVRED